MNSYECIAHFITNGGTVIPHRMKIDAPDPAIAERVARRTVQRRWGMYCVRVERVEVNELKGGPGGSE